MVQTTDTQAPRLSRRQRTEAAIADALGRRWEQAAARNRVLLAEDASDMEAANRLGKALTELDDLEGAEKAYLVALAIDSGNSIARKNLGRIQAARADAEGKRPAAAEGAKAAAAKKGARSRANATPPARPPAIPSSIIEASGISAEFVLQRPALAALREIEPGDALELMASESGVAITTERGVVLGQIEPRAGLRLRRMIEAGNRYTVILREVTEDGATVHIRESYRHPSLVGQVSFLPPPSTPRKAPRAYSRPSAVVRYDADPDEGDDDEEEEDVWRPRGGGGRKPADELAAGGFSEARAGDAADEVDDDDEEEEAPAGVLDDEPTDDDEES